MKMKIILILAVLMLLAFDDMREPTVPIGEIGQPIGGSNSSSSTGSPTPVVEQPDSLPLIGFPWYEPDDLGYCPMTYGYGWDGSMAWPVVGEVRPFGHLPGTTHAGIDISTDIGTEVVAPVDGEVVWAGYTSSGFGNMVAIASSGRVVILGHMSEIGVTCGQDVDKADPVGLSGGRGSGAATWPHVHLEVRYNGLAWNPEIWLP